MCYDLTARSNFGLGLFRHRCNSTSSMYLQALSSHHGLTSSFNHSFKINQEKGSMTSLAGSHDSTHTPAKSLICPANLHKSLVKLQLKI